MTKDEELEALHEAYAKLCDEHAEVVAAKDGAYRERDRLVAALSKLFPSYLARHPADEPWEEDWRWIVYVDLPTGQASWHIHDSELDWFSHLRRQAHEVAWDGHTTEQKYARLAKLKPSSFGRSRMIEGVDRKVVQETARRVETFAVHLRVPSKVRGRIVQLLGFAPAAEPNLCDVHVVVLDAAHERTYLFEPVRAGDSVPVGASYFKSLGDVHFFITEIGP